MKILFLILLIADALTHLFFCLPPAQSKLRKVTKLLLMPLLAVCYTYFAADFTPLVPVALLFGFIGDALLLYPDREKFFFAGLSAFGIGHVLYIIVFLGRIGVRPPLWIVAVAIVLYALGIVLMLRYLLPSLSEFLVIPCCVYMVLLSFMSLSAFVFALGSAGAAPTVVFIGSLLFLVSDGVLAVATFQRKMAYAPLLIMSTYIAAQSMIAFGLAAFTGVV